MDKKDIGKKIKEIRLNRGMTLEQFGKLLDSAKGGVNNWEKGRNLPNKEKIFTIAKLGGITVEQLLYENPLEKFSTDELIAELERRNHNVTTSTNAIKETKKKGV